MTFSDIFKLAASILVSTGIASVIIFGMSNWLGKVWANRILEREKNKFRQELEELRVKLKHESEEKLSTLECELGIFREKFLKTHQDKLQIYRLIVDIVSSFLGNFQAYMVGKFPREEAEIQVLVFNKERLKAYGYLSMLAPQKVMDSYDSLVDELLNMLDGKPYDWPSIRDLSLKMANAIREDLGVDSAPISYRGKR
jgi:hypothetical protein